MKIETKVALVIVGVLFLNEYGKQQFIRGQEYERTTRWLQKTAEEICKNMMKNKDE